MDMTKRKRRLHLATLFFVPVAVYIILDIWIGETVSYMFLAPIVPVVDSFYFLRDDLELIFRAICFAFLLCLWCLPLFLFQKAKNIYLKILVCLFGIAIAAHYAVMTWLSMLLWGDRVESWLKQMTNSSIAVLIVFLGVMGSVVLFYICFAILFYRIKNTTMAGAHGEVVDD